jgi:hypothetical protein
VARSKLALLHGSRRERGDSGRFPKSRDPFGSLGWIKAGTCPIREIDKVLARQTNCNFQIAQIATVTVSLDGDKASWPALVVAVSMVVFFCTLSFQW